MLNANQFRTIRVQASAFTPDQQFRGAKALAYLLQSHADRFDDEPLSVPLSQGAQPLGVQFPIPGSALLLLRSKDQKYRLQANESRVDFICEVPPTEEGLNVADFVAYATGLFRGYMDALSCRIGRLACVITRVSPDPAPAKTLATHFCKPCWIEGPLNRPGDFELHAQKAYTLGGWITVNSWIRCKTALTAAEAGKESERFVLVEQDLNTLHEEALSRSFSPDEINRFFAECPDEFTKILGLYFPESGTNK